MIGYIRSSIVRLLITVLAAMSVFTPIATGQTAPNWFAVIHAFDRGTDGRQPRSSLIQANDGTLYGTTARGGIYDWGSIFRLTTDGTETVLHSFDVMVDGDYPSALIQAADGNFYGTAHQTTAGQGPFGFIFRMTPDGTFTTLHAFGCGADGANPSGALVQANDGNFYGTTAGLATDDCVAPATVYRMTPDGTVSTIHVFNQHVDGTQPEAPLIQAQDSNFYGTTMAGGPFNGGTVFRVMMDGTLTVLHAFHYPEDEEGGEPSAALLEAADGSFYGTTTKGGLCTFCGTIFRLCSDGTFQVVYAFQQGSDAGTQPVAPLVQAIDGNFYGTTWLPRGAVFQLTGDGDFTVLHTFAGDWDGAAPQSAVVQTSDGAFYGTAGVGGPAGTGTVFRVTADGTFDVIYAFPGSQEGASPSALIRGADGNFYGTAQSGGTFNAGTVFQMTPDGSTTSLHSFRESTDGAGPSTIIQGTDGTFYGLTTSGGVAGAGTFFHLTPDGNFTILQAFAGDPLYSQALASTGLLQAVNGSIYGATSRGGDYGRGALFQWTPEGTFTLLYSFSGAADGRQPVTLLQASDGNLYGTTYWGGAINSGTLFCLTSDGTLITLQDLDIRPLSHGLIQASDSNLYITSGTDVLRRTLDGVVTVVHTFGGYEGYAPHGLVQAADRNLYGTAYYGGSNGTAFRMTLNGTLVVLHAFSYPDEWAPDAVPLQGSDGQLYGATWYGGGSGKQGVVYRLTLDPEQPSRLEKVQPRNKRGGDSLLRARFKCSLTSCCDWSGASPDDGRFPVRPSSLIPSARR
jgi:uncharacterized repeat protein (TIGR03803 family)